MLPGTSSQNFIPIGAREDVDRGWRRSEQRDEFLEFMMSAHPPSLPFLLLSLPFSFSFLLFLQLPISSFLFIFFVFPRLLCFNGSFFFQLLLVFGVLFSSDGAAHCFPHDNALITFNQSSPRLGPRELKLGPINVILFISCKLILFHNVCQ